MKLLVSSCLFLSLAACSEAIEEHYANLADAERAGATERGWIPAFVPDSAQNISDIHDLDRNSQTLDFTVARSDVQTMVTPFPAVTPYDQENAAKLRAQLGFPDLSEAYVVCSKPLNGILVVVRDSGRTVYTTPIPWADDDCSRSK